MSAGFTCRSGSLPSGESSTCRWRRLRSLYSRPGGQRFFNTLKTELVYQTNFTTRQQARSAIFAYIEVFYNRQRRHSTLGYVGFREHSSRTRARQALPVGQLLSPEPLRTLVPRGRPEPRAIPDSPRVPDCGSAPWCADESGVAMRERRHRESRMIDVRQRLELPSGASGTYYSLPLLEKSGSRERLAAAGEPPHPARIGAAQPGRPAHPRRGRRSARALAAQGAARRGGAVRRRARAAPGLHRRAAARRPRGDALGGGAARP